MNQRKFIKCSGTERMIEIDQYLTRTTELKILKPTDLLIHNAIMDERERYAQISAIAENYGMGEGFVSFAIEENMTVDEVREIAINAYMKRYERKI